MTTYNFPDIKPSTTTFELVSNTRTFQSPLNNAVQTVARKGAFWKVSLQFDNLVGDNRAEMQAFLTKLNGQQHRFFLQDHSYTRRGTAPTVSQQTVTAGNFQVGAKYIITSVGNTNFVAIGAVSDTVGLLFTATGAGSGTGTATANNLLISAAGQTGSTLNANNATSDDSSYLKAGDYIAFNNELHMLTDNAASAVNGTVSMSIAPPIRKPTILNGLIDYNVPVLGVFMLTGSSGWDNRPPVQSSFTVEAMEDVLA